MIHPRVYNAVRRAISTYTDLRITVIHRLYGIDGVAHALQYLADPMPTLSRYGASIGADTIVYPGVVIHAAQGDFSNLRIGPRARIVRGCLLDLTDRIDIQDEAVISLGCKLITHQNIAHSPLAKLGYRPQHAPITVCRGAVLFSGVTVLMGVTVGECAMVAAGAVVLSDVPSYTLVGGIPAKVLKELGQARCDDR